jgi:hypothetical protein
MPTTPEGKAQSRMNAVKHGLRATDEIFLAHLKPRDRDTFSQMRDTLHERYKPQTDPERELVDQISIQHFRLYRLYDLENVAFSDNDDTLVLKLDRFSRYDWRIDRRIRTLHNRLCGLFYQRKDFSLNSITGKD